MATHSSVLAWRIPGAGEPGGLPSKGSHRVRHDWSDSGSSSIKAYAGESWRAIGNRASALKGNAQNRLCSQSQSRGSSLKGPWVRTTCWSWRASRRGRRHLGLPWGWRCWQHPFRELILWSHWHWQKTVLESFPRLLVPEAYLHSSEPDSASSLSGSADSHAESLPQSPGSPRHCGIAASWPRASLAHQGTHSSWRCHHWGTHTGYVGGAPRAHSSKDQREACPDNKNQKKTPKKRKLQINITDEHRYKSPQQNISKLNSAKH